MPRLPRPDDLASLVVPTDPRLSPDGATVAFVVQSASRRRDGYHHALWCVPTDGSAPARALTLGWRHDTSPRWSPDGTVLAFLSDRRLSVEDAPPEAADPREDAMQVHLLPLAGGEARRLTDLPRGVDSLVWSPDGTRLAVVSSSLGATRREDARLRGRPHPPAPSDAPLSDYRYFDRLQHQANGHGFLDGPASQLWVVDAATGTARRLTSGDHPVEAPAWSPDGTRIAFACDRSSRRDLRWGSDVWIVEADADRPRPVRVTGGRRRVFFAPAWSPDGRSILALGHRFPVSAGSRSDVWVFASDGSESGPDGGRDVSAPSDLMIGAGINSDVTIGEGPRLLVADDGRSVLVLAPAWGAQELWRIDLATGSGERLTEGAHALSAADAVPLARGGLRVAVVRSSATVMPDVCVVDVPAAGPRARHRALDLRPVTALNAVALAGVALSTPVERRWTVDGRTIQGWWYPPLAADGLPAAMPAPLVLEIHGGPMTAYGYAPFWEWQTLAAAGIGVLAANPRGSDGYGQAFADANVRDWGDGPTRDLLAGVDLAVAEGWADPARLGVTGGSYGGYLTSWIVGHDDRFAAAITCRSVNDLAVLMGTGDIAGPEFGRAYFGEQPWEAPDVYRSQSPIAYVERIRTPLLIQHAEQDLRTTIAQGEMLFAALRTLGRPVRIMRVPGESHELTRSGTPFRRVENLVQIRDWFIHFLVKGKRRLPPPPAIRGGL
jgi:dipeptidyl aminopeptidase/acylaminoacyl peptidase